MSKDKSIEKSFKFAPRAMKTADAAHYIGCSKSYLDHLRVGLQRFSDVSGPPFIKVGGNILYLKEDLDEWLDGFKKITVMVDDEHN